MLEPEIVNFLKTLIISAENDELSQYQTQLIEEFHSTYEFQGTQNDDILHKNDQKDIVKFVILGWFIYSMLSKSDNLNKQLPDRDKTL